MPTLTPPPPVRVPPPPTPVFTHRPVPAKTSTSIWSYAAGGFGSYWPDYAWPHRVLEAGLGPPCLPNCPELAETHRREWIGHFHTALAWFSELYCTWYDFPYSATIVPLPFGLILKWADGTTLDEARSMMAIRAAGFPCPKVISVGCHLSPSSSHRPASILMTRVPGEMLDEVYDELSDADRGTIEGEIKQMLETMRSWKSPWGPRICSISGGSIRSIRVPDHRVGPCESEAEFTEYLLSASSSHSFKSQEEYLASVDVAKKLDNTPHRVLFTHGDFALHNILVHEGHVSGFIDWECAGWYPEYWEFTTPLRWPSRDPEGGGWFRRMGDDQYESELKAEMALKALTVDSWIFT